MSERYYFIGWDMASAPSYTVISVYDGHIYITANWGLCVHTDKPTHKKPWKYSGTHPLDAWQAPHD